MGSSQQRAGEVRHTMCKAITPFSKQWPRLDMQWNHGELVGILFTSKVKALYCIEGVSQTLKTNKSDPQPKSTPLAPDHSYKQTTTLS